MTGPVPQPRKPVILTVDDDPAVSRAVARDLRRHYGERYRITGQLLFADEGPPPDALAILWRDSALAARASGDETVTFVIEHVAPGEYRLEILSPSAGRAIRIASLSMEGGEV